MSKDSKQSMDPFTAELEKSRLEGYTRGYYLEVG